MFSLFQVFNQTTFGKKNFDKYKDVLEYLPNNYTEIRKKNITYNTFVSSILNSCYDKRDTTILVSLSGGVDSMVLITVLHFFSKLYLNSDVVAVHINYNNRNESLKEQYFLEDWCAHNKIKMHVKSINDIKRYSSNRSKYEAITKNIRLDFYKEILIKENSNCVMLAHHKDDIVENIFTNVCRGRNILDLAVIKDDTTINNINFVRPMNEFYKNTIYEFSNEYQIPYFKDTTPLWSVRGKYRNVIYPTIECAFTSHVKENLLSLSNQSNEWNGLIETNIIAPFMNKVVLYGNKIVFKLDQYKDYPLCFWNLIFIKLFNKFGYKNPSKKSVTVFLSVIQNSNSNRRTGVQNITLSNQCKCHYENDTVTIELLKI